MTTKSPTPKAVELFRIGFVGEFFSVLQIIKGQNTCS